MSPQDTTPGFVTPDETSSRAHAGLGEKKPLHFPTQRPDEHVILLLRRHWTVLARDVTQLVISLVLPPAVLGLLFYLGSFTIDPGTPLYVFIVLGLSLYYLFSFLAFFHDFVDYHLDIWVVTDQRVVSIEQAGLFNRVVSELNLLRIQDVTSHIVGKVQTFLDYGQVDIQTAGEQGRFLFEQVSHPAEVAKIILQVHDRAAQKGELDRIRQEEAYRQQVDSQRAMTGTPAQQARPAGVALPPQSRGGMVTDNITPAAPVSMPRLHLDEASAPAQPPYTPPVQNQIPQTPVESARHDETRPHYSEAPHVHGEREPDGTGGFERRHATPDRDA